MKNKKNVDVAYPFLLFLSVIFLSIGYASINSITNEIKGKVTATVQQGVFITDVAYVSSNNANRYESKINNYHRTTLNSSIVLSPTYNDSSITYRITLYNNTTEDYSFNEVLYADEFYDNNGIIFTLEGLKKDEKILGKSYLTFYITFSYLDSTLADNNMLNSYLNFDFIESSNVSATDDLELTYTIKEEWTEGETYYYKCEFILKNIGDMTVNSWTIDIPIEEGYKYNSSWGDSNVIFNFDDSNNINISSSQILVPSGVVTFTVQIGINRENFEFSDIQMVGTKKDKTEVENNQITTEGLNAVLNKVNNWSSGSNEFYYQYSLSVTNTLSEPISDWQVVVEVPEGSDISQFWNIGCEIVDNLIIITQPSRNLEAGAEFSEGGIIIIVPDADYVPVIKK